MSTVIVNFTLSAILHVIFLFFFFIVLFVHSIAIVIVMVSPVDRVVSTGRSHGSANRTQRTADTARDTVVPAMTESSGADATLVTPQALTTVQALTAKDALAIFRVSVQTTTVNAARVLVLFPAGVV